MTVQFYHKRGLGLRLSDPVILRACTVLRPGAPSAVSQPIDALICPRWTIAVEPDTAVQEALCLAVQDGNILELLPREQALERYVPAAVCERPDHVLMPGLVNAHTHAAMTLMRGFADDLPLKGVAYGESLAPPK